MKSESNPDVSRAETPSEEAGEMAVPVLPKGYRAVRYRDLILWTWATLSTLVLLGIILLAITGWNLIKEIDLSPTIRPAAQIACSNYWTYVQVAKLNGATLAQVENQYQEVSESISVSAESPDMDIRDLCGDVKTIWDLY